MPTHKLSKKLINQSRTKKANEVWVRLHPVRDETVAPPGVEATAPINLFDENVGLAQSSGLTVSAEFAQSAPATASTAATTGSQFTLDSSEPMGALQTVQASGAVEVAIGEEQASEEGSEFLTPRASNGEAGSPEEDVEMEHGGAEIMDMSGEAGDSEVELLEQDVHTEMVEASDYTLDAGWLSTAAQGDFMRFGGKLRSMVVVMVNPEERTVAFVCEAHGHVTSVRNHMRASHCLDIPRGVLSNLVVDKFPVLPQPAIALPFVKIEDGVKCLTTGKVVCQARHLSCCSKVHTADQWVKVKMQRIGGQGAFKTGVEVRSREEEPVVTNADTLFKSERNGLAA